MKNLFATIAGVSALALLALCPLTTSFAGSPLDGSCDKAGGSQALCQGRGGEDQLKNTVVNVGNLIAMLTGAAAVIFIIYGGIQMVFSGGDQSKVMTARKTVTFAVLGLVVALSAGAIINFVLKRVL